MPAATGRSPFVGRDTELAVLTARLSDAVAGHGGLALIAGEPGIGKTRLAEELATVAREGGVRVLWGRCYEGEGAPAFWPWVEILRVCLRGRDPETLRPILAAGAADLAPLVPEVREICPDLPVPPALEPAQARFRLFDAVATFLIRDAASQPLLLLLDDLHWADVPSLLLLEFLARDLADASLLVVAAYRDVEVQRGDPLARTLGETTRRPHVSRLTLAGLSRPEVAEVIEETRGMPPSAALVSALVEKTEGNPLYLTELVRLLDKAGISAQSSGEPVGAWVLTPEHLSVPPTVREVIGRRLDRLSVECNRVLAMAAVIGREFDLEVLGRAAEFAGVQLLAVLEEAEAAYIIVAVPGSPGRYRFGHALIRESLYDDLASTHRTRLHRQAGEALEAVHGPESQPHLAELAWHFSRSAPLGDGDKAVTYAERAASRAMQLAAYEEAVRHVELALAALAHVPRFNEERRCELLLALGKAYAEASAGASARETYREAAAAARRLGSAGAGLLARAALGFSEVWAIESGVEGHEQIALMEEAVRALGDIESPLRAMLLGHLASRLAFTERRDRAPTLLRDAEVIARRTGDGTALASVLGDRHWVFWAGDDRADRLAAAREIVQLSKRGRNPEMALWGHDLCVVDLIELGDIEAADAEIATCARLAGELRAPFGLWRLGLVRTMRALLEGRFADAERLAHEAWTIGDRVGLPDAGNSYRGQTVMLRGEQGRLGEVVDSFAAYVAASDVTAITRCILAFIFAETDRLEDARREIDRLSVSGFSTIPRNVNWLLAILCLSRVCATLGDVRHAATLYRLLSPHAQRIAVAGGAIVCLGTVSHYLGTLATTAGDWEAAERHFEDALARHQRLRALPLLARTRLEYATMLLVRNRPIHRAAARDLAEQARVTARDLGMARLEAQALAVQDQLRHTTATGRAGRYPDRLTAREVEVLVLVSQGKTNREIATTLVLSVPTVQNHLATIYRKINARNRADATAYAFRRGLATPPG